MTWIPQLNEEDINVIMNGKGNVNGMINILSYELASKLSKQIIEKRFQIVIVDESHYLKNSRTKRAQSIVPMIKNSKRAILLTGTPALSRPSELFTQLNALEPRLFQSFHDFGVRYCDGHETQFGW